MVGDTKLGALTLTLVMVAPLAIAQVLPGLPGLEVGPPPTPPHVHDIPIPTWTPAQWAVETHDGVHSAGIFVPGSGGVTPQTCTDYYGQVGEFPENTTTTQASQGQATEIQVVMPTKLVGGYLFYWVGATLSSGDFLQVGYFVPNNQTNVAHPFNAWLPHGGTWVINEHWNINLNPGDWHLFWEGYDVGGTPNKWGFWMDSFPSGDMGDYFLAGASDTGNRIPITVNELGAGSNDCALASQDVLNPAEYHYAMQYYKGGVWYQPSHGYYYNGYPQFTCTQLGFAFVQANDVKLGGNVCPAPTYGTQEW